MHRLPTKVPSYGLHKSKGLARVIINGQHVYLGRYNSPESWEKYRRLIARWMADQRPVERQKTKSSGPVNLSIAGLVAQYLYFAESYYSDNGKPTSEFVCMRDAAKPLCELYASSAVSEFGPLALKNVRQRMVELDWCRKHINHQVNRIRRIFRWGVENELVPAGIVQALQAVAGLKAGRTVARETKPIQPVNWCNVEPVLPFVSLQVATMIQLQSLTGMRPGEVIRLRPCDIDTRGIVWTYKPPKHKTTYRGHERTVYIGPKARELLQPWMNRIPESFCFSPAEAEAARHADRRESRRTPITPSQAKRRPARNPKRPKRDRYDTNSYRQAINYGIRRSGAAPWHPNQLRHSLGTEIRNQFGLDVAQIILGHRSADITQVYAEPDRAKAIEVMKKIG